MEERGNKTIMCSVFFLDIVGYSKKSVTGQISLKDRFNTYLSTSIRDVPVVDRIILDTGDGAVINFLGDLEDALKAALSLRDSLLGESADVDPPLLVRMGVNLGPVRLVRDINGQPNIVGDGINVAQRVMSFADASQILVSRSYYDAVSRLSPQYAKMFHYQGSRTDKHVREHEVYAIGYPGDKTTQQGLSKPSFDAHAENLLVRTVERVKAVWCSAAMKLDNFYRRSVSILQQAEPQQRAVYVGVIAIPLLLLIVLAIKLTDYGADSAPPAEISVLLTSASQAVSAVESVAAASNVAVVKNKNEHVKPPTLLAPKQKVVERSETKSKPKPMPKTQETATSSSSDPDGHITISCREGTELFVDGVRKARVSAGPLTINVSPGKHAVIVSHPSAGVFSQDFIIEAGKTVRLNPGFCNK